MKDFDTLSPIEQRAFPGARTSYREQPEIANSDSLWMMTEEGDWIAGVFAPGKVDNQFCIIHFYGSHETLRSSVSIIESLRSLGPSVVCFDYRGYGASGGRPNENQYYADAEFIFDWLKEHHPNLRPIFSGRSLGTAVATHLATHRPVEGLIMLTPPTNMVDVVRNIFETNEIIIEEALPFRFDNLYRIASIKCPIFISHGMQDEVISYRMSRILEFEANAPVTYHEVPEAKHNNLVAVAGASLWDKIAEFLEELA